MKKNRLWRNALIVCLVAVCVVGSLAACSPNGQGSSSQSSSNSSESSQSQTDLLPRVKEVLGKGQEVISWYTMHTLTYDTAVEPVTDENGREFYPVVTFRTMDELKQATQQVYSQAFAEENLYSIGMHAEYGSFKEIDGILYGCDNTGMGWMQELKPETAEIVAQEDNIMVVKCQSLNNYEGGKATDEPFILVKENGQWLLDSYYTYSIEQWYNNDEVAAILDRITKGNLPISVSQAVNSDKTSIQFVLENTSDADVTITGLRVNTMEQYWNPIYQTDEGFSQTIKAHERYTVELKEADLLKDGRYKVDVQLDDQYSSLVEYRYKIG